VDEIKRCSLVAIFLIYGLEDCIKSQKPDDAKTTEVP
jgi:hypothetical protein